ncbi:MAG: 4-hydroxythreonine-4-phosphate dehydrogenase PdxA [Christensenellaceae bacterium]|nr:4-hydroxythreonine-4-phosphate dehydrogenase PdxA [Christensenellaceae bacterium]
MKKTLITMGDPAGVGPEISLKAVESDPKLLNSTVIVGSLGILKYYKELLKSPSPFNVIENMADFKEGHVNIIDVLDLDFDKIKIGEVSPIAGNAAYQYLEKAIGLSMAKEAGPVVTGPLNKEALHLGGHNYDGHTEIFATLTKTPKYTMMLWSEIMSVVHVSTHCSLRDACDRVKKERVLDVIHLGYQALKNLGVEEPKLAVAGLNPHSGENGIFGSEDIEEITPAIEAAKAEGINVEGPVPPDTVFLKASKGKYDLVVAMYHDQGHIPMKMLAFDSGVNTTLGLPIIRTSVDHGTAFDIAGKGIAREESMLWALKLGTRFAEHIE